MKRLAVALLVFGLFTPTVFAQSVEQKEPRVFSAWREKVKSAEMDYKNKNGRYGDLGALRGAHLLRNLVFESCSSQGASRKARVNFVPKSVLFQVPVSGDGQHFDVAIVDEPGHCGPPPVYLLEVLPGSGPRDFRDSPEGPIIPFLVR